MPALTRRDLILMLCAAALPVQASAKSRTAAGGQAPWTAAEEQKAARQAAELIAEKTGEEPHPAIGDLLALDAAITLLDGQRFDTAAMRDKLLLTFFWASWCPICKAMAPRLQAFWLANRHRGVELLTLSADTSAATTRATRQKLGYRFPVAMAQDTRLGPHVAARSLPTLLVRSKRGVIVAAEEGGLSTGDLKGLLVHL